MNVTLKDLPKILKEYKNRGFKVEKQKYKLNNRIAYRIDGKLLTDKGVINQYQYGIY